MLPGQLTYIYDLLQKGGHNVGHEDFDWIKHIKTVFTSFICMPFCSKLNKYTMWISSTVKMMLFLRWSFSKYWAVLKIDGWKRTLPHWSETNRNNPKTAASWIEQLINSCSRKVDKQYAIRVRALPLCLFCKSSRFDQRVGRYCLCNQSFFRLQPRHGLLCSANVPEKTCGCLSKSINARQSAFFCVESQNN